MPAVGNFKTLPSTEAYAWDGVFLQKFLIKKLKQGVDQWFVLKKFYFLMLQNLSVFAVGEVG